MPGCSPATNEQFQHLSSYRRAKRKLTVTKEKLGRGPNTLVPDKDSPKLEGTRPIGWPLCSQLMASHLTSSSSTGQQTLSSLLHFRRDETSWGEVRWHEWCERCFMQCHTCCVLFAYSCTVDLCTVSIRLNNLCKYNRYCCNVVHVRFFFSYYCKKTHQFTTVFKDNSGCIKDQIPKHIILLCGTSPESMCLVCWHEE